MKTSCLLPSDQFPNVARRGASLAPRAVRWALAASLASGLLVASVRAQASAPTEAPAASSVPAASAAASAPSATATSPSIFDEDPSATLPPRIPDKIEGFNRGMFKFNDVVYRFTLRPIAKGYAAVVPAPIRRGIGRFFHNLAFPTRFVGNVFEGRLKDAGTETGRFVINSALSLGFLTPADDMPALREKDSDLGQAFGTWGIGHGTYLILPVLGPSSIRDGVGLGLSGYFLDPIHYLQEWEYRAAGSAVTVVNQSPEQMNAYDQLKQASVDPYAALRDAYSARRTRRTANETQVPVVPAATAATPAP